MTVSMARRTTILLALLVATTTGCGGHSIADPFASGTHDSRVLFDRVDCDPTPDTCTRYVILEPQGVTTADLEAEVQRTAVRVLRWTPVASGGVDRDEGREFAGR